jgi:hypothetical protein
MIRRTFDQIIRPFPYPVELQVLHIVPSDNPPRLEKYWQEKFAARQLRGEWFDLSPEDIAEFCHQGGGK